MTGAESTKNSPTVLGTGLKDLELEGFKVTTSVFCFASECPSGSISDSILATKSVKDKKFNQVNVKDLMALLINQFMRGLQERKSF